MISTAKLANILLKMGSALMIIVNLVNVAAYIRAIVLISEYVVQISEYTDVIGVAGVIFGYAASCVCSAMNILIAVYFFSVCKFKPLGIAAVCVHILCTLSLIVRFVADALQLNSEITRPSSGISLLSVLPNILGIAVMGILLFAILRKQARVAIPALVCIGAGLVLLIINGILQFAQLCVIGGFDAVFSLEQGGAVALGLMLSLLNYGGFALCFVGMNMQHKAQAMQVDNSAAA